jgi:hypothetical protein
MSDPSQPSRYPSWLAPVIVVLLGMQLVLGWIHGSQLNRQHQDLLALREDVQNLTDAVDQGFSQGNGSEDSVAPARRGRVRHPAIQRVRLLQEQPTEEEQASKDLKQSRDSAQQAVAKARQTQSQLSIEENIRKADEKAKMESAENSWQKWMWVALGVGLLAVVIRFWARRRG